MADTTRFKDDLSRGDVARYLRDIAAEFDDESSPMRVTVGNKEVTLQPSPTIDCETEITERSRMIGKDNQTITLTLSWAPDED